MDHEKIGRFIAERRKMQHMTQKELAGMLNITDKAVSKWERGLSCPDIALLGPLAEALQVTTGELLKGERSGDDSAPEEVEVSIGHALQYADQSSQSRIKRVQNVCAAVFTTVLLLGAAVCAICDVALTGGFTWSLYPISSIVFGWVVLFPVIKFGVRGIKGSLAALTVLLIPFLYVIGRLAGEVRLVMDIGVPAAGISLVYLWGLAAVFRVLRHRMILAGAVSLWMAVPVEILVSWSVSRVTAEPVMDVWDILSVVLMGALGLFLIVLDRRHGLSFLYRKREEDQHGT